MDMRMRITLFFFGFIKLAFSLMEPSVEVSTLVLPVKEGAILSFYCKISNLNEEIHEVTISRQIGESNERLSWKKSVLEDVDERVFLAIRLLEDGSFVYFLTITNVKLSDEGRYWCTVLQSSDGGLLAVDRANVDFQVQHFPGDQYPICSSGLQQNVVKEGTLVTFNCTSEEGNPVSTLSWQRDSVAYNPRVIHKDGRIQSLLSMRLTRTHQNSIFTCSLKSASFPDKLSTCHVGPLRIILKPLQVDDESESVLEQQDDPTTTILPIIVASKTPDQKKQDCRKLCPALSSPINYWIIGTIAALLVAIVFFMIAIATAVKLHRTTTLRRHNYVKAVLRQPCELTQDELYEKLRYRTDDDRIYMALEKGQKPRNLVVAPRMLETESNYTVTPTSCSK